MGVVYEAWHKPLERHVALKVLSTSVVNRANTVKRFFQEARAMARISHPRIVPVYEVASDGELPYFAMELVTGGSLKDALAAEPEGRFAPRRAAEIARDIADALAHAHELKILHRDVKPGNVLMSRDGTARLTDFGLVQQTDTATLTASDAIVGTPQYMSPEQVRSQKLDGRSDQFSLGSTLYEMLVGEAPFSAGTPVGVLRAIVDNQPVSIRKHRPQVPASLEAVVMRMLEKDPDRRYPDMGGAREDLERYLRGEAVEATLPGTVARAWRRLSSNRLALRYAMAFLVLAGAGAFYVIASEGWIGGANRYNTVVTEASIALRTGDAAGSESLLMSLTDEERNRPEILVLMAQVFQRKGGEENLEIALSHLGQAIAQEPGNLIYLEMAVQYCEEIEDYRQALDWLDDVRVVMQAGAADAEERKAVRAGLAFRRAVIIRRVVEQHMQQAATILDAVRGLQTPEGMGASFATSQVRDAEEERERARSQLSVARGALVLHHATHGRGYDSDREEVFLTALEAQLTEDPQQRGDLLDDRQAAQPRIPDADGSFVHCDILSFPARAGSRAAPRSCDRRRFPPPVPPRECAGCAARES